MAMTSPEFEPLPDAQSDQEPTPYERSLIVGAIGVPSRASKWLAGDSEWSRRDMLRMLRAGYEAGRRSVLQAPVRVWREGDPPPECTVTLLDRFGELSVWAPAWDRSHNWPEFLAEGGGPLVEIHVNYDTAVAADAARRAALKEGTS